MAWIQRIYNFSYQAITIWPSGGFRFLYIKTPMVIEIADTSVSEKSIRF